MASLKFNGLGIHIKVADVGASRGFYEGLLGLRPVFAYGDQEFLKSIPDGVPTAPEIYHGVTYELVPGSPLEIADGHRAVEPMVFKEPVATAKISGMLRVASFVPLLAEGFRPKVDVRHYYWGTLEMAFRDPDGWVIVLIAPYSDAERDAIKQYVPVTEVLPG